MGSGYGSDIDSEASSTGDEDGIEGDPDDEGDSDDMQGDSEEGSSSSGEEGGEDSEGSSSEVGKGCTLLLYRLACPTCENVEMFVQFQHVLSVAFLCTQDDEGLLLEGDSDEDEEEQEIRAEIAAEEAEMAAVEQEMALAGGEPLCKGDNCSCGRSVPVTMQTCELTFLASSAFAEEEEDDEEGDDMDEEGSEDYDEVGGQQLWQWHLCLCRQQWQLCLARK